MDSLFLSLGEALGEDSVVAIGGLLIGVLFGAAAQRSRFCLRAAAIEFARGDYGQRLAVWLLAFSAAVVLTQLLIVSGVLGTSEVRQLTRPASLSGAIIGGAMFGIGMVLARGCSSRMLILAGQGNLRALLNGLIFAVTAQAALRGILSPAREDLASLWLFEPADIDLLQLAGVGATGGVVIGLIWFGTAIYFGRLCFWRDCTLGKTGWIGGLLAGVAIAAAWGFTASLDGLFFMPVKIESLTFTGPSANALMLFLSPPGDPWRFDVALVPGVFIGSFLAAAWARELKLEGFQGALGMRRYMLGAAMMGFGGMLAGGCAVGSVTNASVFALTGWVTLLSIFGAAALTDRLLDAGEKTVPAPFQPDPLVLKLPDIPSREVPMGRPVPAE